MSKADPAPAQKPRARLGLCCAGLLAFFTPAIGLAQPSAPDTPNGQATQRQGETQALGDGLFEASLAGDEQGHTDEAALAPPEGTSLNGYVRGVTFIGKADSSQRGMLQANYAELALELRAQQQELGDAYAEVLFQYGLVGEEHDLFLDLAEAYVNTYLGPLDLRVGKQIIVWGRIDGLSPTNNVTPADFSTRSPELDDRRLGNVGVRALLHFTPIRLEGVWMPVYQPTVLPPLELPERVVLRDNFPPPQLQNGLFGGRAQLQLSAFELSLSYIYGPALLPGIALAGFSVGEAAQVSIERLPHRHHVAGFDFSTALGQLAVLRGEAAYKRPVHYQRGVERPRPELAYAAGLDRTVGNVSVSAQYFGKYVQDWEREPGPESPLDANVLVGLEESDLVPLVVQSIIVPIEQELSRRNQALFQQTARLQHLTSLRLEWFGVRDTLSLSALGLYNFSTQEWLLYPRATYHLSDSLRASVGAEVYSGPDGTLLDLIEEQLTAGYAELRASF